MAGTILGSKEGAGGRREQVLELTWSPWGAEGSKLIRWTHCGEQEIRKGKEDLVREKAAILKQMVRRASL